MKGKYFLMSTYEHIYFIIKLYENKPRHYKHIYFIIKLYVNKPRHYKHIYFIIKLYGK